MLTLYESLRSEERNMIQVV